MVNVSAREGILETAARKVKIKVSDLSENVQRVVLEGGWGVVGGEGGLRHGLRTEK